MAEWLVWRTADTGQLAWATLGRASGSTPQCCKGFCSHSQLAVQTLFMQPLCAPTRINICAHITRSQLAVQTLFMQPLCVPTRINICAHITRPWRWPLGEQKKIQHTLSQLSKTECGCRNSMGIQNGRVIMQYLLKNGCAVSCKTDVLPPVKQMY